MDYDKLIAECLAQVVHQQTPPPFCKQSLSCKLAGGCPGCIHTKPRSK